MFIVVVWSFTSSFQVVLGVRSCFVRFGLELVRTRQVLVQQQEPLRRSGALTPSLRRSDLFLVQSLCPTAAQWGWFSPTARQWNLAVIFRRFLVFVPRFFHVF